MLLLSLLFLLWPCYCQAQDNSSLEVLLPYTFSDLPRCNRTSAQLNDLDSTTAVDPCILYDTFDDAHHQDPLYSNVTTVITVVGVFHTAVGEARDGALVAVQRLNSDNGATIGYYKDHFVKFRFVAGIPGNRDQLGPQAYAKAHQDMLRILLRDLTPQYILGTHSFNSELEREIAGEYRTMLLAQVGPQAFYTSNRSNDHVFGVHIPSEGYGIPAFQALRFQVRHPDTQPIRIIYRDRSEFFYSTCRAVYDRALAEGFTQTMALEYNPEADENGNGIPNQNDVEFLQGLADRACPANSTDDDDQSIAVWGCFLSDLEANTVLERLRHNGCRLNLLWLTTASWAWAHRHPHRVPFLQAGGQWHKSMQYGDEYFANGQALLDHMADQFGYVPAYGALGSYHGIYMMYQNVKRFFKGKDVPRVEETFASPEGYEEVRRSMLDLSLPHSLYGPTSLDEFRRNAGRGSAGMQWDVPTQERPQRGRDDNDPENDSDNQQSSSQLRSGPPQTEEFELLLVSPIDQATAAVHFPAPSSKACKPGSFLNATKVYNATAILRAKCSDCPVDTFAPDENRQFACQPCVKGSSTEGQTGATVCIQLDDNLVPSNLLVFGYAIMVVVFLLSIGFAIWTVIHRDDPVVRIGQVEFLLLICLGPIISSSSIAALSTQAGSFDDETAANRACAALPWLYSTGWMLQYGSLSAKSYRMYNTMRAAETMQGGRTVTVLDMYKILVMLLLLNWAIVIPWHIVDPLSWDRHDKGTTVDTEQGVLTYESYGSCSCNHFLSWGLPILALQVLLMAVTNYLLYKIRNVSDRYQESKYVAMASAYACEFLIVGIPILIAVGENAVEASYIVLVCIVGLSDMGILLMIFVPKVLYSRKGLPEGVTVGQSIFKRTSLPGANRNSITTANTGRTPNQLSEQHQLPSSHSQPGAPAIEGASKASSAAPASLQSINSLTEIVKEGVTAEPVAVTPEDEHESKKHAEEGALVNNMTLQW